VRQRKCPARKPEEIRELQESIAYVGVVLIGLWRILDEPAEGEVPAECQENQTVAQRIAAKRPHHRGAQPSGEAITHADSFKHGN